MGGSSGGIQWGRVHRSSGADSGQSTDLVGADPVGAGSTDLVGADPMGAGPGGSSGSRFTVDGGIR